MLVLSAKLPSTADATPATPKANPKNKPDINPSLEEATLVNKAIWHEKRKKASIPHRS